MKGILKINIVMFKKIFFYKLRSNKGFMDSYGLNYSDDNDIQEAKQIINEMKKYP